MAQEPRSLSSSSPVRIVLRFRHPKGRKEAAPQSDGCDIYAVAKEGREVVNSTPSSVASLSVPGAARALKKIHKLQHKLQLLQALRSTVKQLASEPKVKLDAACVQSPSVEDRTANMYEVGSRSFSVPGKSCETAGVDQQMAIGDAHGMSDFGSVMSDFGTDDKYAMLEELSSVAPDLPMQCTEPDVDASWNPFHNDTINASIATCDAVDANDDTGIRTNDSFEEKKAETDEETLVKVAKVVHSDFMDTVVIDAQERAKVLVLQIFGSEGVEAVCLGPQQQQRQLDVDGQQQEQGSLGSAVDGFNLSFIWYMERLANEIEVAVKKEQALQVVDFGQNTLDESKRPAHGDDFKDNSTSKPDDGDRTVKTDMAVHTGDHPVLVMSPSGVMSNFDDAFNSTKEKHLLEDHKQRRATKVGFADSVAVVENGKDDDGSICEEGSELRGVKLTRTTNIDKNGEVIHVDDSSKSDDSDWARMQRIIKNELRDTAWPSAAARPRGYTRRRTGSFASGTTADSCSMGPFPADQSVVKSSVFDKGGQKRSESLFESRSFNSNAGTRSIGSLTNASRSFGDTSYGSYEDLPRLASDIQTISSEYTSFDDNDSIQSDAIPDKFSCSDEISDIAKEISTKGPGVVSKWLVPV